jgi:hypothetical protein
MKAFKQIRVWALSVVLFAVGTSLQASPFDPIQDTCIVGEMGEYSKNYSKSFSVNQNDIVFLSNRYGKVNVKPVSGNQVNISVTVKVHANSQSEADKVFDRINIAFSNGPEFVKAETEIESKSSGFTFWNWNSSSDFSIDYEVTMPTYNRLDCANKYGNSSIGAMGSFVKVDQKYGDFKLESASTSQIYLAYGGGNIGKTSLVEGSVAYGKLSAADIKDVKLKSKYSEFRIDKSVTMDINSAYDDYEIGSVTTLKSDSRYGDMTVDAVENLTVVSQYTDYRVRTLGNNADFQSTYGDVKINNVKNGFGTINLKGSYTDFYVDVDPAAGYQVDVTSSYADISRPASLSYKLDKEKGSTKEIMGYVGNAASKSVIRARLSYGDLVLK